MSETFLFYILLVLIILGLVMLAQKFRTAYPIVLVLGGLDGEHGFAIAYFERPEPERDGDRRQREGAADQALQELLAGESSRRGGAHHRVFPGERTRTLRSGLAHGRVS